MPRDDDRADPDRTRCLTAESNDSEPIRTKERLGDHPGAPSHSVCITSRSDCNPFDSPADKRHFPTRYDDYPCAAPASELGEPTRIKSRRIFELDPLLYPQCGVETKGVAVIQDVGVVTDGWGEWWGLIHLLARAL